MYCRWETKANLWGIDVNLFDRLRVMIGYLHSYEKKEKHTNIHYIETIQFSTYNYFLSIVCTKDKIFSMPTV